MRLSKKRILNTPYSTSKAMIWHIYAQTQTKKAPTASLQIGAFLFKPN